MPNDPKQDPQSTDRSAAEGPRTDLPPKKLPYDDDYFGTGEEEGVVRERQASDDAPASDKAE